MLIRPAWKIVALYTYDRTQKWRDTEWVKVDDVKKAINEVESAAAIGKFTARNWAIVLKSKLKPNTRKGESKN